MILSLLYPSPFHEMRIAQSRVHRFVEEFEAFTLFEKKDIAHNKHLLHPSPAPNPPSTQTPQISLLKSSPSFPTHQIPVRTSTLTSTSTSQSVTSLSYSIQSKIITQIPHLKPSKSFPVDIISVDKSTSTTTSQSVTSLSYFINKSKNH